MNSELLAKALAWKDQDPDPVTRAEVQHLIDTDDEAGLRARFDYRLAFGTAGIRGELGAGPNRMNRVLVAQAAAGIANWLLAHPDYWHGRDKPSIVIGFDGRINSDVFAEDSAAVFAGAGIEVLLFDTTVPTPIVAFSVKQGDFSAGIMVTASHNPPRDNGYKVYLGGPNGGSQIIPPVDAEIAREIEIVASSKAFANIPMSDQFEVGGQELQEQYLGVTANLISPERDRDPLSTVYTAMHGVGWPLLSRLFELAGLPRPAVVRSQIDPDGTFPTVSFPNPEEPGALDASFEEARRIKAQLILANDPDADRLAVAVPNHNYPSGFRIFTGDELGLILGAEMAKLATENGESGTIACSIVSSSALQGVALFMGLDFTQTLTGFKWISKVPQLIFGYEEALGYSVDPKHTPDKDGISAALVIADLAARLTAMGLTLEQHLVNLGELFGHFATGQVSVRLENIDLAKATVARLRQNPPTELLGMEVTFTDLSLGSELLPATDGLRFDLEDGRRIIVRPSGTEPKLKCYLQVIGDSEPHAKAGLEELTREVRELIQQP